MIELQNIGVTYSVVDPTIYDRFKLDGDAEIFEKLVMDLMLNKYSEDKELTEYILGLPKEKQRMAVLSVIDGDNVLWSKMNAYVNECSDKFEHIKDVVKIINKFVKDGEVEKKKFGEVMTPITLVREMLDTLPKEVWSNPNLKWLDPANGAGTFPFVVIYKLMNGLKDWEPDTEKRYKHIVEKMIYVCELQSRNVFLWLCGVDPKDEYTTNTYWGSFLEPDFDKHMKEVWGVDKFDIVVGNPPYQTQKDTIKNKESKSPKTQPLWHLFVQKSLSILNEGGYMVMVHPGAWRDLGGQFKSTQDLLISKQIKELHIFPYKSGLEMFGAKINFDYYILKNVKNSEKTKVFCENGVVELLNLSELKYIPGENISYINNLFAFDGQDKVKLLSDSKYHTQQGEKNGFLNKSKTSNHNLPCVYMVSYKNNPSFWYSNINKGHFGISKVIWGNGSSGVIVDTNGDYGLTQFCRAIVDDKENLDDIKKALESEKFIKMVMLFKDGLGHKYNNKVISMLRKDFWRDFI